MSHIKAIIIFTIISSTIQIFIFKENTNIIFRNIIIAGLTLLIYNLLFNRKK